MCEGERAKVFPVVVIVTKIFLIILLYFMSYFGNCCGWVVVVVVFVLWVSSRVHFKKTHGFEARCCAISK